MNQYNFYARQIRIGPFTTSRVELMDLLKAWIVISISYSLFETKGMSGVFSLSFLWIMLFSGITVGIAFLFHEIAHKAVAQHYGCFAEFRADNAMLLMALVMAAFFSFIFLAPGAVLISGPVGKRRNGMISASGPATNFALAAIFVIILFYTQATGLATLFFFGYQVNTWIGLFNMIPVWLFDGKKIWDWNPLVYAGMAAFGISLLLLQILAKGVTA